MRHINPLDMRHFNSHAHVERDDANVSEYTPPFDFNSHAHVERDVIFVPNILLIFSFQLTRSRGA